MPNQRMGFLMTLISYLFTLLLLSPIANAGTSKLFREYIGAEYKGVHFSDVPINTNVEFHFLLAFALDYTDTKQPLPTNGQFNKFWDADNLTPEEVMSLKRHNHNVRVAISLGGDSIHSQHAYFAPESISSWVKNAAASLTRIIREYHLDGIDVDYEHFKTDPNTFAECTGQLITLLKERNVISFASIAPYDDVSVQSHYQELWRRYHRVIDYVNFQFYAYDKGTSVQKFLNYFDQQASNYRGGQILASFSSDNSGGLKPENGFFSACEQLKMKGKLGGIFVWSADDSKKLDYRNEKRAQQLLAS